MTISNASPIWSAGLDLLSRSEARLLDAAAGLSTGDGDFFEGVTNLNLAKFEMRLGVGLIKTAHETLGTLLDLVV